MAEQDQKEGWILVKSKRAHKAERRQLHDRWAKSYGYLPKLIKMKDCNFDPGADPIRVCDYCQRYSPGGYDVCTRTRLIRCVNCPSRGTYECDWDCQCYNHYVATQYCPCIFEIEDGGEGHFLIVRHCQFPN